MRDGYPLVELHRHLDGNLRIQTIIELAKQHHIELPAWTPEELLPHVQVTTTVPDLKAFLDKFALLQKVIANYDAVRRITWENLEDAAREGIDAIELRFSPAFMAHNHALSIRKITETVCHAVDEAKGKIPVIAKLIVIMSRHYAPELCDLELHAAIEFKNQGVVALDLAGDEKDYPGDLFIDQFHKARDAGLHLIAHAGEAAGAQSIEQAIHHLHVERIGHGIAARNDPRLMDLIMERGITLECCPTSNVQTCTVKDYDDHPLPMFLRRGMKVTLNTDDPSICGVDLPGEFQIARTRLGLSDAELRRLQEHALHAAFLTGDERSSLLSQVTS